MKKITNVLLSLLIVLSITACQSKQEDIVIVYTNDVHTAINTNIGYAGLVSYVDELKQNHKNVTLIDAGDAYQGSTACAVSNGEAIAEILQDVDYDIMTFGNHEFDYGIDQLINLMKISKKHYINSNIVYTGSREDNFLNDVNKYEIIKYGNKKVAYVSFDTPQTVNDSVPTTFIEDGETAYNFFFGGVREDFFTNAQKVVDECKQKGADYVVAICHLGQGGEFGEYASNELASQTSNIDVIIDAHAHQEIPCQYNINKDGKEVLITSSGVELNNIGQVVISANGYISTSLITNYPNKDETIENKANEIIRTYTDALSVPLFTNNYELSISDENGVRKIRNREMQIGDLTADAIRYYAQADIAIANGGGIRDTLPAGEVSYNDFIKVFPFGNKLACIEVSGSELLDYLEYCYSQVDDSYVKDGKSYGENGSFMQISGMKLTIDTSIPTSITVDETDNFVSVGDTRRVKDVQVLNENGEYKPIDKDKIYSLGSLDYNIILGGSGTNNIFKDNNALINGTIYDYEVFSSYIIDVLKYDLSGYQTIDNRIIIE